MGIKRFPEADLHCHTTASDGLLTPYELIKAASEIGLKAVGITDHDTVSGWSESIKAGKEFGVEILKGIELNTEWQGTEVHILGYEPDQESKQFQDKLRELREARMKRMLKILDRLHNMKIDISVSEIKAIAKGESVGRPHIAQALIQHGYAKSIKDAFTQYIGAKAPAYVPRFKLAPKEGINLIREAGGVAVLAHPGQHDLGKFIQIWVNEGLQGVEVSHSDHTPEEERQYREISRKFHLIMTGGSDFHGEGRKMGVKLGGWGVSYDVVEQIRDLTICSRKKAEWN